MARYRTRMEVVDKWMAKRHLPLKLRSRIGHYYAEVRSCQTWPITYTSLFIRFAQHCGVTKSKHRQHTISPSKDVLVICRQPEAVYYIEQLPQAALHVHCPSALPFNVGSAAVAISSISCALWLRILT